MTPIGAALSLAPARTARWRHLASALATVCAVRGLLWGPGLERARRFAHAPHADAKSGDALADERIVAWSVSAAARLVPQATCLTQALAGQRLLARRGRGSRVVIGVRPQDAGLHAHAWLIRGDRVLLGGAGELDVHECLHEIVFDPGASS